MNYVWNQLKEKDQQIEILFLQLVMMNQINKIGNMMNRLTFYKRLVAIFSYLFIQTLQLENENYKGQCLSISGESNVLLGKTIILLLVFLKKEFFVVFSAM